MSWLTDLTTHYRNSTELANIFAIVLFTDRHANIKKALSDSDFWLAFNEISGPNFAVFSIKPQEGHFVWPKEANNKLSLMVPIWKEPKENLYLLDEFEIKSTKDLPFLLIFTHDEKGDILKFTIELDDSTKDSAYQSLKSSLQLVAEAISYILPENRNNPSAVFNAVSMNVDGYMQWRAIKKGINFFRWIVSFFP